MFFIFVIFVKCQLKTASDWWQLTIWIFYKCLNKYRVSWFFKKSFDDVFLKGFCEFNVFLFMQSIKWFSCSISATTSKTFFLLPSSTSARHHQLQDIVSQTEPAQLVTCKYNFHLLFYVFFRQARYCARFIINRDDFK